MDSSEHDTLVSDPSVIELEPFIHQVGGRSAILVFGDLICKPLNERELSFYQSLDEFAPQLGRFVPHFKGVISVNFSENKDGYLMITTRSADVFHETILTNLSHDKSSNRISLQSIPDELVRSNIQSPHSPYQKFETKYRLKLVKPLKEVIIESQESDSMSTVTRDLECSKEQLENLLLRENRDQIFKSSQHDSPPQFGVSAVTHNNPNINNPSTNLYRSRSTSVTIPSFEDGNSENQLDLQSLFDNPPHLTVKSGQTNKHEDGTLTPADGGFFTPKYLPTRQSSVQSSPLCLYQNQTSRSTTKHNPWVLKTISAFGDFNGETKKEQKFIMLENLVSKFQFPCIMDLKMGNRLHDDDASQTKRESHQNKVNETTSGILGLRITGIQIYDTAIDRFVCYNKYYGRKLNSESFKSTLRMFVSNENFITLRLLDRLIGRLKKLRNEIVKLDTFRFYTSSLLIIYEGNLSGIDIENLTDHELETMLDVRIIDFAHFSVSKNIKNNLLGIGVGDAKSGAENPDYDYGFVFGLDNLIKILTLFSQEKQ